MTNELYIPWNLQDPKTGITHYQNSYADHSLTLCGLDAEAWVGFDYSIATCEICKRTDATMTRYEYKKEGQP